MVGVVISGSKGFSDFLSSYFQRRLKHKNKPQGRVVAIIEGTRKAFFVLGRILLLSPWLKKKKKKVEFLRKVPPKFHVYLFSLIPFP